MRSYDTVRTSAAREWPSANVAIAFSLSRTFLGLIFVRGFFHLFLVSTFSDLLLNLLLILMHRTK